MKNRFAKYSLTAKYAFILGTTNWVGSANAQSKETLYIAANNQTVVLEQEVALGADRA